MKILSLHQYAAAAKAETDPRRRDQLQAVAEQFEAMFLQQILKQMRQAGEALEAEVWGRRERGAVQHLHDQALAENLARAGELGIADLLVRQLGSGLNADAEPVALEQSKQTVPHASPAFAQPVRPEHKETHS